jgi:hypothetical protein
MSAHQLEDPSDSKGACMSTRYASLLRPAPEQTPNSLHYPKILPLEHLRALAVRIQLRSQLLRASTALFVAISRFQLLHLVPILVGALGEFRHDERGGGAVGESELVVQYHEATPCDWRCHGVLREGATRQQPGTYHCLARKLTIFRTVLFKSFTASA